MEDPSCHTANSEGLGTSVARIALGWECAACGSASLPADRFCAACGTRLAGRSGSSCLSTQHPAGPAETCRQVSILFADIADSTEQIAQLAPEQAMHRLEPAIDLMCEAVERFGGTVMRTLGDGVMALFGAPAAMESHARLACESALHMQAAFARSDSGLSIRVGLHSGWVACDAQPHNGRTGGLAHGLAIHLASRVQNLALPGGVVITRECHSLVTGEFVVEPLGRRQLKGVPEPVEIFKLAGLKVARESVANYAPAAAYATSAAALR